ncbi:ATP-binding protein [Streptomyces sp. NBC_00435]|uniref:ATP-binding protein n=1 Tax=Streptomyces sp. NBC_00435 TaxID=2903649 RepID=UPI002E1EA400
MDFLQFFGQDEITRREIAVSQRHLARARFEQQVTLEEFVFTVSSKLPPARIRDLGVLRWLDAGGSDIFFGPVGVGKTHVAQAPGPLTPSPVHVPIPRQVLVAEDADEVLLPNDVQLLAGGTAPEHHLVGEAGRALDPGCVQSLHDGRARADVRAESGRLVTHLSYHPLPGLRAEAHLPGPQWTRNAGSPTPEPAGQILP